MKSKDLQEISIAHVMEAASIYDPKDFPVRSVARNTVVKINGVSFPVKNIGFIAYKLAYGKELPLEGFTTIEMSRYLSSLNSNDIIIDKLDPASTEKYDFFEESELIRFGEIIKFSDGRYRKGDDDSLENGEFLKILFEKSNYWAKLVVDKLPDFIFEEDNRWQIMGSIKKYSWATVFLRTNRAQMVFFTLGADSDGKGSLLLKLDCQRDGRGSLDARSVTLFDTYLGENKVGKYLIEAEAVESYDWERLVEESVAFVQQNLQHYKAALHLLYPETTDWLEFSTQTEIMTAQYSLNTILYGPPGTGKTYKTIDMACDILGFQPTHGVTDQKLREEKRAFFEKKLDDQVEFITFHQSMSYENYIEGIKPETVDDKNIIYKTRPGIFTEIAYRALKNIHKYYNKKESSSSIDFGSIYKDFLENVRQRAAGDPLVFATLSGSRLKYDKMWDDTTMVVYFEWNSSARKDIPGSQPFRVRMEKIKLLYDNNVPKEVRRLKDEVGKIVKYNESVYYAVYKDFLDFVSSKYPGYSMQQAPEIEEAGLRAELTDIKDYGRLLEQTEDLLGSVDKTTIKSDPYILIIDEINRGNVSQIFGELITLIEDDKRFLKKEGMRVKLSYSGSEFSVPPNLYIIGTMNTADRSVEALDTALRRRFSFIEMPPQENHNQISKMVKIGRDNFNFQEILGVINRRLEMLVDRDHKIGHSYFMDVDGAQDWRFYLAAFENKIVPLLQEYFYGDYGKIGLVLGKGFVAERRDRYGDKFFAAIEYDDLTELAGRRIWEIRKIEDEQSFANAMGQLLNKPISSVE